MKTIFSPKTLARDELWGTGTASRELPGSRGVGFIIQTIVRLGDPETLRPHLVTLVQQPGEGHRAVASAQPYYYWTYPYGAASHRGYPNGDQLAVSGELVIAALQQRLPDEAAQRAIDLITRHASLPTD